eukprot:7382696-Prymnesium_polylepis.1
MSVLAFAPLAAATVDKVERGCKPPETTGEEVGRAPPSARLPNQRSRGLRARSTRCTPPLSFSLSRWAGTRAGRLDMHQVQG